MTPYRRVTTYQTAWRNSEDFRLPDNVILKVCNRLQHSGDYMYKASIKSNGNTSIVLKCLYYQRQNQLDFFNVISLHVHNLLAHLWKASYTISASISVDVLQWPPYGTDNRVSSVVTLPSQWFFHFGEDVVIARTHIGWVWRMLQYLPSPTAKEILHSVSSETPV
jgi:hypothetical protein